MKPCPWCKSCRDLETIEYGIGLYNHLTVYHVECGGCLARGPQGSSAEAAQRFWNEWSEQGVEVVE
jgi:hypothetical protein